MGLNVPKWCQSHEGARRANSQIWREYKANGRTQRDSTPRPLVPKNNVAMPASVYQCRHVLSIPSLYAKNVMGPSVWRGPAHSRLAQ
jgi:hypothetical protein